MIPLLFYDWYLAWKKKQAKKINWHMCQKKWEQTLKDIYFLDCRYYYNVRKDYAVPMTHQIIGPHTGETIEYFNFLKKAERKIAENYKKWVLPLALGYTK